MVDVLIFDIPHLRLQVADTDGGGVVAATPEVAARIPQGKLLLHFKDLVRREPFEEVHRLYVVHPMRERCNRVDVVRLHVQCKQIDVVAVACLMLAATMLRLPSFPIIL